MREHANIIRVVWGITLIAWGIVTFHHSTGQESLFAQIAGLAGVIILTTIETKQKD